MTERVRALDETTESAIGAVLSNPCDDATVDALRARIHELVEAARWAYIGTMTHVDYDDD